MKKVILLSGSPNLQGNTMQVFQECAEVLAKRQGASCRMGKG